MKTFKVIETKTIEHTIEITDGWPIGVQQSDEAARTYFSEASENIGFDAINKLESKTTEHSVCYEDGEEV